MSLVKLVTSGLSYTKERIGHLFRSLDDHTDEEDISGKIVVITGANAGLGKVLCLQMAKRKATVIMACRDLAKAKKVIDEIKQAVPVKLDLEDLRSVRACATEIGEKVPQINLLICNAGYISTGCVIERTKDGFEKHLSTNHLGHFVLTNLLLEHIQKGVPARIVITGSFAHQYATLNLDDINMEKDTNLGVFNLRPYSNSKLCNMLFARELSKRLESDKVHVYTLCPGLVDTGIFDDFPKYERIITRRLIMPVIGCKPEQGVETILYCALSMNCATETGKVYRFRKYWKEADEGLDDEQAAKLWDISEKLVDLKAGAVGGERGRGANPSTEEKSK